MIFISNVADLFEKMSQKIQSRLKKNQLIFSPNTKEEVLKIIKKTCPQIDMFFVKN